MTISDSFHDPGPMSPGFLIRNARDGGSDVVLKRLGPRCWSRGIKAGAIDWQIL
jgi:hypothetical protein